MEENPDLSGFFYALTIKPSKCYTVSYVTISVRFCTSILLHRNQ